ncbi:hypothetical protein MOQ_004344 [Trypanosoma cruzi marinkellei]|uniref:Uncharacterized protein n=1 Tax=Trypanosoma cruzi marinkellei TaxID=85056 RepID=K2MXG5_TRYCR|nr:hypothetical protein MOQ_004344 [Trypanosoma cruzi marinkellei]
MVWDFLFLVSAFACGCLFCCGCCWVCRAWFDRHSFFFFLFLFPFFLGGGEEEDRRRIMRLSDTTLSEAERYAVWCEEIRTLFGVSGGEEEEDREVLEDDDRLFAGGVSSGISDTDANKHPKRGRKDADGGEFPYCFYMRMLSSGKEERAPKEVNPAAQRYSGDNIGCGSDSDGVSFVSRQQQQRVFVDEDKLAARIASKLNVYARRLRREHHEDSPEAPVVESNQWTFRDGRVEALSAKVNEELHELLMYVRRRNLLAEQLRRQLVHTKQLLLYQKEATS